MKQVYGRVNLRDWTFTATENLAKRAAEDVEKITAHSIGNLLGKYVTSTFIPMVEAVAAEALTVALASDDTDAYMPAVWEPHKDGMGGPSCDDPLTVYLRLDLGADGDTSPTLKTSINTMVENYLENCAKDGSFRVGLTRIRDALRELASRIDKVVSSAPTDYDDKV